MIKGLRVVFTQEEKTVENIRKLLEAAGITYAKEALEEFVDEAYVALLWRESVSDFYLSNENGLDGSEMTLTEAFHFIDEIHRNERREMEKDFLSSESLDNSKNNGGETDYYKIESEWKTFQDVIEARNMNYAQGNIFKVACTFNIGRHSGTDYERELNKIIYFAKRELAKLNNVL